MTVTSTSVTVGFPGVRPPPPSAAAAESLVFAALILQILGAAILTFAVLLLFGATAFHPIPFAWIAGLVAGILGVVAIVFLYVAYEYSYLRIRRGDFAGAQGPTLVIGVLSLFLGLIPGILYLIGYLKLGDTLRELQFGAAFAGVSPPFGTPVIPQQACRGCGRVYFVGQVLYCPNCGLKFGGAP